MSDVAVIANAVLAFGILIGYVVLTALNHDGTPLLVLLGGQGGAVAVGKAADATVKRKGT